MKFLAPLILCLLLAGCLPDGGSAGPSTKSNGELTAYISDAHDDVIALKGHTDGPYEPYRASADKTLGAAGSVAKTQAGQLAVMAKADAEKDATITRQAGELAAEHRQWFSDFQHEIGKWILIEAALAVILYVIGRILSLYLTPGYQMASTIISFVAKILIVINPFGTLGALLWYESHKKTEVQTQLTASTQTVMASVPPAALPGVKAALDVIQGRATKAFVKSVKSSGTVTDVTPSVISA